MSDLPGRVDSLRHSAANTPSASLDVLRKAEERFRQMVEHAPLAMHMWRLEPDGRLVLTHANPAADHTLGVNHRELTGQTIEDAFPSVVGTSLPAAFRRVAADGGSWTSPEFAYQDSRISGIFEVHAYQSNPGTLAVTFADITARRRAETALRESAARHRRADAVRLVDRRRGSPVHQLVWSGPEEPGVEAG